MIYAKEVKSLVSQLLTLNPDLKSLQVASFDALLEDAAPPYPYHESFDKGRHKPVVVLHSSGSTGNCR